MPDRDHLGSSKLTGMLRRVFTFGQAFDPTDKPSSGCLPEKSKFPALLSKTDCAHSVNLWENTSRLVGIKSGETIMPLLIALAIAIGLISVPVIWTFLDPLAPYSFQIWQCFLAWGCFYHCGGKAAGAKTTIICMAFGAVVGALVVISAGYLGFMGALAVPVAGAVGAALIVLAAHIPVLSTIPASVYGFAGIAAFILLTGATPLQALLPTIGSMTIGALVGWVSEFAGTRLAKST
jgi:hypothetical protein